MSSFWSGYIIFIVVLCIVGNAWLLFALRKNPEGAPKDGASLGHDFDGIQELNNPLPRWWLWVFVLSIVFAVIYLARYPGLGSYKGMLDWTSKQQWQNEIDAANARYGPIYAQYAAIPIPQLLSDPRAVTMGERLFALNCSPCHGSDARGGKGFPNLTDGDWLYGGDPDTIQTTILNGRIGVMPPMIQVIGGEQAVADAAQYVLSLSGRKHDAEMAQRGQKIFNTVCFACHGPDGKGNPVIGSANLTDNIWLYGGTEEDIRATIRGGRIAQMPAHKTLLGEAKVHLLALYVYSLSHSE